MWEINNQQQIISFLLSVCLGVLCCIIYDIIKASRNVCFNSLLAITLSDILLWIFYAFTTFLFLIARTNGEIRGYVLIGEMIGFFLCRVSISKLVYSIFKFIFQNLYTLLQKINTSVVIFYTKFERILLKAFKLFIKILKSIKKLLKNTVGLLYTNVNIFNAEKSINETKTET